MGCLMHVWSKKLQNLKDSLNIWNKDGFGNIHYLVKTSLENLGLVQDQISRDGLF